MGRTLDTSVSAAEVLGPDAQRPELERFELLEELGHGGMATVYRARDCRLGREVAVKVIHRHLRHDAQVSERFTAEARTVARLRHPNIVEVYDVSDDRSPERYIVVELVRGTNLRKLLQERGRMPAEVAAGLGLILADALDHAHAEGVVHRDVKPENVLIGLGAADGRTSVKLTDFGIAKLLDAEGVTSTGQVLGSPAHMAPEQIEGGDVSVRTDVFSLGVLLYECMTGVLPFDGKNPAQVLRRVLECVTRPAHKVEPTVGVRFWRVLATALHREPEERPATIAAFADALRGELERVQIEDGRALFYDWLKDGEATTSSLTARLVERLVELGRQARRRRVLTDASDDFNRALALRPDDPELLRTVSRLATARRRGAAVRRAAAVSAISLGAFAVAWAVTTVITWFAAPAAPAAPGARPRVATVAPAATAQPVATAVALPSASSEPGPASDPSERAPTPSGKAPRVAATRPVQVLIRGATGGTVEVAGSTLRHGQTLALAVDQPHVFRFIPPAGDCCLPSSQTVRVPAGADPFVVQGVIRFRPARIAASGAPEGATIHCGYLGEATAPRSIRVPMNEDRVEGRCSVLPKDGSPSRTVAVTLTPGRTVDLWP